MGSYKNEIEQFIYEVCYNDIWASVSAYVSLHPYAFNLEYSRIKYPDRVILEEILLEFPSNIRIVEDSLLFEAVISCTLKLIEDSGYDYRTCESSQWLRISCDAVVTDKLESMRVTNVSQYVPGINVQSEGQQVSRNIVPIIYKKDLDAEAEAFLKKYFPAALEAPTPVPIREIAESMGLDVIQGKRITEDFSIFGEICFSEGKIEVYDIFKCKKDVIDVRRGTILIDTYTFWERNLGCVNNTIAHEVFHWYKHRMYAAIKHILRGDKLITCRCPSNSRYPKNGAPWTDEQRMEWQANSMAPRILMPKTTFIQKVSQLYKQYNYIGSPLKRAVVSLVADDLAKFYGVSRQSAIIRMIECGFNEASDLNQYNSDSKYHSYLSNSDAFYEYTENHKFRKLIDSGAFCYVDGHFVINDEQYIQLEDGRSTLTEYAWNHLDECCLQFTYRTVSVSDTSKWPYEIFHRANNSRQASSYHSSDNDDVIRRANLLREKQAEYEVQKQAFKITAINKTCWQVIFEIIQARGLSKSHFCNLTLLGEEVYRKAEKNVGTPKLRTIVAIACGLDLDLVTTERILQLAGHAFDESDEHQALKFCISGYRGSPIEERNDFLESYGFEPLGSKQQR